MPAARQHEIEVRLAVRTAEERVGALAGRADALARQAAAEREARARAEARRAARARGAAIAAAVVVGAEIAVAQAARALVRRPGEQRDAVAQARVGRESELADGPHRRPSSSARELERLTSKVHRDEVARAEQRMRIEQLEARRARRSTASTRETLIDEYGPHLPVPPTAPEIAAAEAEDRPAPEPVPYRPRRRRRSGPPRRNAT